MAEHMDEDTSGDASPLKLGLTCPVCLSIFEDPVVLPCSHSFCRECLKQSLRPVKMCPLCRKPFEEGGETSNRSLRDVCETFNKYSNWGSGHKAAGEDTCTLHGMPLALYCEKDEEPVCADCVSLHNTHKLWTLKDGVPLCKVRAAPKHVLPHRKTWFISPHCQKKGGRRTSYFFSEPKVTSSVCFFFFFSLPTNS